MKVGHPLEFHINQHLVILFILHAEVEDPLATPPVLFPHLDQIQVKRKTPLLSANQVEN